MIAALLPVLAPILGDVVRRVLPDSEAAAKAEAELTRELLAQSARLEAAAADIIRTEAASTHWLAANWRPITMLTFLVLIVSRWYGVDLAVAHWLGLEPRITDVEYAQAWDYMQLGLSGYVIGRSAEKIAPGLADALRKK